MKKTLLFLQLLHACCFIMWLNNAFAPAGNQTHRQSNNRRNENENTNAATPSYQQPAFALPPSFTTMPNMHSAFTPSPHGLPFAAHPSSAAARPYSMQNIINPSAQYSTPLAAAPGAYTNGWQVPVQHNPQITPFQSIVSAAQGYQYPQPHFRACPATQAILPLPHSLLPAPMDTGLLSPADCNKKPAAFRAGRRSASPRQRAWDNQSASAAVINALSNDAEPATKSKAGRKSAVQKKEHEFQIQNTMKQFFAIGQFLPLRPFCRSNGLQSCYNSIRRRITNNPLSLPHNRAPMIN